MHTVKVYAAIPVALNPEIIRCSPVVLFVAGIDATIAAQKGSLSRHGGQKRVRNVPKLSQIERQGKTVARRLRMTFNPRTNRNVPDPIHK